MEPVGLRLSACEGQRLGVVMGRARGWVRWAVWTSALVVVLVAVPTVLAGSAWATSGWTAYVTNAGSDTVTPIDTATNTAGPAIAVGATPGEVAITPDGKTAYVANFNSATVPPISTTTNTAGAEITVGSSPHGVAITPDQAPVAAFSVSAALTGQPSRFDG
jgi:YVTN family beta-propeller protein